MTNAEYFRKLADEATHWHVVTDTDLATAAQEAIESLAMYEEGHICEECGHTSVLEVKDSICDACTEPRDVLD